LNLLDLVILIPAIGFLAALFIPRANEQFIRLFTLGVSLLTFVASLGLATGFDKNAAGQQFVTNFVWIQNPEIHYHVGIDGLSLWMVLLATFLTPIAILISWTSIEDRVKEFFALLLLLEFGLVGVFSAWDLFLFYVFWEIVLVPMYFLIGIWGHDRRIYAAVKFFLYTMAGSVLMLAAIIFLYTQAGTFDYVTVLDQLQSGRIALSHLQETLLFLAFFLAFAIKVPLFPLHTWLPDAHVEAPTAGSVMLASVMLKMGTYGLVRFCLPMFPVAARENSGWIVTLAIIGIIYGALVAMVQPNMKKLVAYSSVSHLGFVVLGVFSFTQVGLDGAVYQMLNHGISTGALFVIVGFLYGRKHSLLIADFGGVATAAPWLSIMFMITTFASIGLPTLNNFVGEFLILQGAAIRNFTWAAFASLGVILSACYMLWMYQRVFFGRAAGEPEPADDHGHGGHDDHAPVHAHAAHGHDSHGHGMPDLSLREWACVLPLVAMMVWMGMYSQTFLPAVSAQDARILTTIEKGTQASNVNITPVSGGSAHAR
jgi:NADH-quinone oxidoreductase subunit M